MRFAPVLAVLAFAAAGCTSSTVTTPPASTAAPAAAAPAGGGSYATAQDVLDALAKAGAPCVAQQAVANPTANGATSMVGCDSTGTTDGDTVVVAFDSHDDAVAYAKTMADFGDTPKAEIVGVNWAVNTVPAYGAKVLAKLGGVQVAGG